MREPWQHRPNYRIAKLRRRQQQCRDAKEGAASVELEAAKVGSQLGTDRRSQLKLHVKSRLTSTYLRYKVYKEPEEVLILRSVQLGHNIALSVADKIRRRGCVHATSARPQQSKNAVVYLHPRKIAIGSR